MREDPRGAKHGLSQWQYEHWKAKDATKGPRKKGNNPLCNDGRKMKRIGLPKQFMVAPIDISFVATWKDRLRCESLVLNLNGRPLELSSVNEDG